MRKILCILICLALLPCAAMAEESYDGQVVAGEAVSVTAPFGGVVRSTGLRQGTLVAVGDEIALLDTTRVLATEDGTIRGVFASAGDSAASTVMYLAPVSKYTVSASIAKAYDSAETTYVTIGEKVYLRCTKDKSHRAEGVIIAVKGSGYTIQTTAGELYMEETVNVYRTADYASTQLIGSGTVSRTEALPISGKGSILKMYVKDGESVERGQLLFETVNGDLAGLTYTDGTVRSTAAGVVAEVKVKAGQNVNQHDVLMTVYQPGDYQIRMNVPEDMLSTLAVGDEAQVYFNWNETDRRAYPAQVSEISYMSNEDPSSTETTYSVYLTFRADESVRLGMNVTVVLP